MGTSITNTYGTANQNGTQYGNLTKVEEFDGYYTFSAANRKRTTITDYYPNLTLDGNDNPTIYIRHYRE